MVSWVRVVARGVAGAMTRTRREADRQTLPTIENAQIGRSVQEPHPLHDRRRKYLELHLTMG
jgi:hypothetical protein